MLCVNESSLKVCVFCPFAAHWHWRDVVIMTNTLINPDRCGRGLKFLDLLTQWLQYLLPVWQQWGYEENSLERDSLFGVFVFFWCSSIWTDVMCAADLFASIFWLYVYSVAIVALNVLWFWLAATFIHICRSLQWSCLSLHLLRSFISRCDGISLKIVMFLWLMCSR